MAPDPNTSPGLVMRFSFTFPSRRPTGKIHLFEDGRVENNGGTFGRSPTTGPGRVAPRMVALALEVAERVMAANRRPTWYGSDPSHALDLELYVGSTRRLAEFRWERVSRYDPHYDPLEDQDAMSDFDTLVTFLEEFERVSRSKSP